MRRATAVSARLRASSGADAREDLVDLDAQGTGLMLELAGVIGDHVRVSPGAASLLRSVQK